LSNSTDRVLAAIDEAVDGYITWDPDTSTDAMRWRPEKPTRHAGRVYLAPEGALADGPTGWTELGYTTDGGFARTAPVLAEHIEAARHLSDQLTVTFRANLDAATRAFASIAGAMRQVSGAFKRVIDANHPAVAPAIYGDDYRRHRRTCRRCNPAGNPKPMPVNGAEYQRRTRSRRHRNRR
jgi:hypothetical protein